jgi:hypothetical protein
MADFEKNLAWYWWVLNGISALGDRNTSLWKETIMKTRTTSSILVLILAFFILGAMQAQAIIVICQPVGITLGQTARLTAANTGDRSIIVSGMFVDSEGTVLGRFDRELIQPGKMMSFDLNRDNIVREGNRIQIRVDLSADSSRGLVSSAEVFENDTGKTTIFVWNPGD